VGFPHATPSPGNYSEWQRQNKSFGGMAAMRFVLGSLTLDGPPEQATGQAVTADFFDVLGVRPALGRLLSVEEDRTAWQVVMISYGLGQRRYQGDPGIIGRTIVLNDAKYSVIAVFPRDFVFQSRSTDYWVPATLSPAELANRDAHYLNVVARLKPGVSVRQAREDMHSVAVRLQEQGRFDKRSDVVVIPLRE